ncbi:hypothetical protein, partial [Streptomyces sp. NPDC031705]|uniref:hypothetical protein n=1 Tax=Streptomyces sp. NPDC031705 TaxID=3155729 RepID=UPI0033D990DB
RKVEGAGEGFAGALGDAGEKASDVPLVGGLLEKPFQSAADAGTGLADAGRSLQDAVSQLATLTAVVLIVVPAAFVLLLWLPLRLRWIRRSAAVRSLSDAPGGADLLALRALTGPPGDLRAIPAPPGGLADAWRRGDREVVTALSEITLRRAGLRP